MNYIQMNELKARLLKGETSLPVQKSYSAVIEPVSARQIKFVISTDRVDRDGDIIKQDGWDLSSYLHNPVVMLNHKTSELPVGKCVSIGVEDGALKAVVEFVPPHIPVIGETAEAVYQLCLNGFMSATSVGFRAIQWDWAEGDGDGIIFSKQELLEFSVVSVPANPDALIQQPSVFSITDEPKSVELNIKKNRLKLRLLRLLDT